MLTKEPIILALDSAVKGCSIGLQIEGKNYVKTHSKINEASEFLKQMLQILLEEASISIDDINAIAVTVGPGSFTGIRVACSFAQSLAYGLKIPLIPCVSLEVLAFAYFQLNPTAENYLVVNDARSHEFYYAVYTQNSTLIPPNIGKQESVEKLIEDHQIEHIGGDGAFVFKEKQNKGFIYYTMDQVLTFAKQLWIDQKTVEALDLKLLYIRNNVTY